MGASVLSYEITEAGKICAAFPCPWRKVWVVLYVFRFCPLLLNLHYSDDESLGHLRITE